MLGNITITCFAASYAVALTLEATRMLFRSGVRGAVMLGFAAAGLLAHTLYLANRWLTERAPLASEYDWYLVAAWALAAVYLYLTYYHPQNPIGLFTLPLVLGLVAVAWFWASDTPFPRREEARILGLAHGVGLLAGTVTVMVGFGAGLMYLIQAWRLKHKTLPNSGLRLPSLEWLGRANAWAIGLSAVFLLFGFVTGLFLSRTRHGEIRWTEPVVWTSSLLAAWMLAVALFNAVYRPARHGRKVAYVTVATFIILAISLAAVLLDPGPGHGGRP